MKKIPKVQKDKAKAAKPTLVHKDKKKSLKRNPAGTKYKEEYNDE